MSLSLGLLPIFLSVVLLTLSASGVGPLDALSGLALGFSTTEVGLIGSAHFLGFFAGCWLAPRLMGQVGHSRSFAGFTAIGTIGLLAHMMVISPLAWALMRVAIGMALAGAYTVIEAWLQARLANAVRARAMGRYRMVDTVAQLGAQLLIAVLPPATYLSYNALALLACTALLPLTLMRMAQPAVPEAPRLDPRGAITRSPLAAAAVITAGLTSGAFRMVGPVWGRDVGLGAERIGLFLAAFVLGGALAHYPLGWLADRIDRRRVLLGLSLAAIVASGVTVAAAQWGALATFAAAMLFGASTLPIYSVGTAHAHDYAETAERVELSAALMFLFAIGAIAAPLAASGLVAAFGPAALFAMIAAAHAVLIVFGLWRMRARPGAGPRTRFVWVPRTSFTVGRLFGQSRERD